MDDPTPQLRARARAGDADAFGAVPDACAKSVYNHAFRLTSDWSAAEEVMAMTFLEAWRSRERIAEDGGSLRPWLLGIATNVARGQRRAARRQRNALARLAVADDLPDLADDVSGRLDDVARIKALHRALAGCPGPSSRSSPSASGPGSATRRRPKPWASPSAPCAPGCPGPAPSWASSPNENFAKIPGNPRPCPTS